MTDGKPRVAIVFSQLGYGGSERQTLELLERLKGSDWQPSLVVCLSDELQPYGPAIKSLGYPLVVLPRRSNFDMRRLRRLRTSLRRERVDLVHAVGLMASAYSWFAAAHGWRLRPRVLPTMRSGVLPSSRMRRLLYAFVLRRASATLVNSYSGATLLRSKLGLTEAQTVVVPNGLDIAALRARARAGGLRTELGLSPQDVVVGFVGKDSSVKNVPLFVQVVRQLRTRHPDVHGVLIGHGLGEEARQKFAPDLPARCIHFLGTRTDVPAMLGQMDVLVLTSTSEGVPNVVLEALAAGTPVVAAAVGDVPYILQHANWGTAIAAPDPAAYADAALEWTVRRRKEASSERHYLSWLESTYSVEGMVTRTVSLWERVLSAPL